MAETKKTNVLVLGGGGREHATCWKLGQSPQAGTITAVPGNPGIAMEGFNCMNIPLKWENADFLGMLAERMNIGLVVIGPEQPIVDGFTDVFRNRGIPTFAPGAAVVIEASKAYAKRLMKKSGIPTADFDIATSSEQVIAFAQARNFRVAIKVDGLAAGKGAFICTTAGEVLLAIHEIYNTKVFKAEAIRQIIVEDLLEGTELSVMALCDGKTAVLMPPVLDHKHIKVNDKVLMTGGMGAAGPVDIDPALLEEIKTKIIDVCQRALREDRMPFVGCLYAGLMLTKNGPMVLEFNARFGDPETQVQLPLLEDGVDWIDVLRSCALGKLNPDAVRFSKDCCAVGVVQAASGYPENPQKGATVHINKYGRLSSEHGGHIFHAGTAWKNRELIVSGGRVTCTVGVAEDIAMAMGIAYNLSGYVGFEGLQQRVDIGAALLPTPGH